MIDPFFAMSFALVSSIVIACFNEMPTQKLRPYLRHLPPAAPETVALLGHAKSLEKLLFGRK
jgi:hypothetical protein